VDEAGAAAVAAVEGLSGQERPVISHTL
jgi:hypothetical protein